MSNYVEILANGKTAIEVALEEDIKFISCIVDDLIGTDAKRYHRAVVKRLNDETQRMIASRRRVVFTHNAKGRKMPTRSMKKIVDGYDSPEDGVPPTTPVEDEGTDGSTLPETLN